jgi:hypothetical protein
VSVGSLLISPHRDWWVARRVTGAGASVVLRTTRVQSIKKEWAAAMRTATHSCKESAYSVWRSMRSLRSKAVAEGICSGGGPRYLATGSDLLVDVGDVPLSRPAAQNELLGDFLVALPGSYEAQHFYFPLG